MLSNRLLYELFSVEKFKKIEEYLSYYEIVNEEPLSILFSINVHSFTYEFIAEYPKYFPHQPIIIYRKTDFKTGHCYKNGAMCLKWGNDNWDSDLTIVDLIKNLYDLLFIENPLGNEHQQSESGDSFSLGQKIRYVDSICLVLGKDTLSYINDCGYIKLSYNKTDENKKIYFIKSIDDKKIIKSKALKNEKEVKYFRTKFLWKELICLKPRELFNHLNMREIVKKDFIIFTIDNYAIFISRQGKKVDYIKIIVSEFETDKRLKIDKNILNKKILILGLGSIGSRVLMDLARTGFNNFILVDNDIMLPYNTVRHELTERHIGEYKVNALKRMILDEINSNINIEVSTLNMLGQESTTSTEKFLKMCEDADLIIDCTANDNLLLLVDNVLKDKQIPLISGTVIPGGLGNIVLIRKKGDVFSMEKILSAYYYFKSTKNMFAEESHDYEATIEETPYVATMSDCSILSGLIGKNAILILNNDNDIYNINVFSTSSYGDLKEMYNTYRLNVVDIPVEEVDFDEEIIKKGKKIYEDYCSRRDSK